MSADRIHCGVQNICWTKLQIGGSLEPGEKYELIN